MKVMIVVTHLLGTGHLSRALTLGRAFVRAGHETFVVSGGMPAPQLDSAGMTLLGLPPLRSDGTDFTRLLTQSGDVADAAYLASREIALVEAVRSFAPDVLITELFPFGRRSLAAEFNAALEAAWNMPRRPVILGSIRDILAPPSKPSKAERTDEIVCRYYDGILVHSDQNVVPLEVSWPVTNRLRPQLFYTGFVAPEAPALHPDEVGKDEILVSAGGGSVGQPIFRAAIEAARKMPNRRWRLLVGGQDARARIDQLAQLVGEAQVILEPVRPDFRQMLPHAAASVSMCGYNTALDILQSGTPAVFIPFDDGKEVEQGLRGQSLSDLSAIDVLPSKSLNGDSLAQAVASVMSDGSRQVSMQGFDGAARSVEIAVNLRAQV
ncbi:undecaprenyldiphospho-muramoylpentapeptide beta-N-acetylglucosaminyltransferase [Ruegeria denitrificans]|uniref:Undecaprenyldiphospho-muramoylpentapeptide beta-N-acetylglucosaminyltransferase n=1 Tax=Ruegeria denitrificans TaxID=1715692 RepID=A0A0P1IWP2_9RHOB|nr:glycosyltransferase [Ruegeria denitrificans]CUK13041.1 undecaprenyldiphospho-muramoylpentapeptide beta-N-acetylglucosaminyltransferase [Ruegeria denitrificans]